MSRAKSIDATPHRWATIDRVIIGTYAVFFVIACLVDYINAFGSHHLPRSAFHRSASPVLTSSPSRVLWASPAPYSVSSLAAPVGRITPASVESWQWPPKFIWPRLPPVDLSPRLPPPHCFSLTPASSPASLLRSVLLVVPRG